MACGDSTVGAKVALVIMVLCVVAGTVAIFTPYWSETQGANGDRIYSGLVVECNNTLGWCIDIQGILERYTNTNFYTTQIWSLSLAMIGWVFSVGALVAMIVYACLPNKILAIVVIFLSFIAGGCIIASVIVYSVGVGAFFKNLTRPTLGWSFGLDAAAGCLAIVAAVVVIINSCIIP